MSTDMVAQAGILHHTMNELNNTFCGRTFIMSRPGFTFSQYMDMLFPMHASSHSKRASMSTQMTMLDKIVDVDVATAEKREFTAQGMMGGVMNMGAGMMGDMMRGMGRMNSMSGRNGNMGMMCRCGHQMHSEMCGKCMRCSHDMGAARCAMCTPARCSHGAGTNACMACTGCKHGQMTGMCNTCMDEMPKDKMMNGEAKMLKDGKPMNGKTNGADMKKERPMSGMMSNMMGMSGMGMGMTDSIAMARECAKNAEGKTMKQLSRLWMYQQGKKPGMAGDREDMMSGMMGMGKDMMGMGRNGMTMRGEKVM